MLYLTLSVCIAIYLSLQRFSKKHQRFDEKSIKIELLFTCIFLNAEPSNFLTCMNEIFTKEKVIFIDFGLKKGLK